MPPKIYTRKGDKGETGLLYGGRVSKSSARPTACGDVDESCASLGLARAASTDDELSRVLLQLQRELFVVGAEISTLPAEWKKLISGVSLTDDDMTARLEGLIDDYASRFSMPADFIVPGNSALGSLLDMACRVIRRAERSIVALSQSDDVRPEVLAYMNRLADLVWMLARFVESDAHQPRTRE